MPSEAKASGDAQTEEKAESPLDGSRAEAAESQDEATAPAGMVSPRTLNRSQAALEEAESRDCGPR